MSEREDELKAQVRKTPLLERLQDCRKRVGDMCAERRGPRMSIPVEYYDDDFYICITVEDARQELDRMERLQVIDLANNNAYREQVANLQVQLSAADEARKYAQEASSKLVEKVRALEIRLKGETVQSVTEWANETFGEATIYAQISRASKEFGELMDAPLSDPAKIAEEAADVCICLFRVIGMLNPQAINLKMAKNRARKWNVNADGTAQHVGE